MLSPRVALTLNYWRFIGVLLAVLTIGIVGMQASPISVAQADGTCATSGGPSVTSDQADYGPRDTAIISGSGFDCGAALSVLVTAPDGATMSGDGAGSAGPDLVSADGNGEFSLNYALSGTDPDGNSYVGQEGVYTADVLDASGAILASTTFADSHFRYGHITWRRTSGRTVEFTVTTAWRSDFIGSVSFLFGDGGSSNIFFNSEPQIASGPGYSVRRATRTHTFGGDGPFTASFSSCCRIGSLVNAANASFRVSTVVDLRNSNQGSPVSSIPVIVQMVQGAVNNVPLPAADPDLDPLTCSLTPTGSTSGIPTQPTAGSVISVSPGCVLTWNTAGTSVGQFYAVQVFINENHAGNSSPVALDFIIQIVTGNIPTCSPASQSATIAVGQTVNLSVTGNDADGGNVTINHLGIPSGATLSPAAGTSGAVPLTGTFSWTPTLGDAGSAAAVSITFTDPGGLQVSCALSIAVPTVLTDVSVSKSDSPDPVLNSGNLTYTLTAHNAGPDTATNVTATDILPAGTTLVSLSAGCSGTTTITCGPITLTSGQSHSWTITVAVSTAATSISNTATITGTEPDGNQGNNSDTESTTVTQNRPPTADANGPYVINEGDDLTLDGSGSTDPDIGDTLTGSWLLDGDTFAGLTTTIPSASDPSIQDDFSGTATLTVDDGNGGSDSASASVTVNNVAPTVDAGPDATIDEGDTFTLQPCAGGVLNPANGHYYQAVAGSLTWAQAKAAAESLNCGGSQGHLVTITSAQETNFLSANFPSAVKLWGWWTGGFQPAGSPEPGGNWQWVTGEPFSYANWGGGEPNNAGGEDRIHFWSTAGHWNDIPASLQTGYVVEFEPPIGGLFSDPGADTWTATVDYGDGGGPQSLALNPDKTFSLSHAYGHAGSYPVTVTVTDDDTGSGSDTLTVTVNNVAPAITTISSSPEPVDEGSPVTITATFTDPSWLDTHTETVDCGGGDLDNSGLVEENVQPDSTGTITAVCTYGHAGTYTVTVTVTDDVGDSDAATIDVTVNNVAPAITTISSSPEPVDEGLPVTITATFSDPSWLDAHTETVACGGGDLDSSGLNEENARPDSTGTVTAVCTYGHAGTYAVTVTVTDDVGDSDTATIGVTVNNVAPTMTSILASATAIDENNSVDISATFSDPSWLDTHTAAVDCGDPLAVSSGVSLTEENIRPNGTGTITATCTYGDNGTFTVTLTVTDDVGASDSGTAIIHVSNVFPVLVLDHTGSIVFTSGNEAFVGRKDIQQAHNADGSDVGSDDLTFDWGFPPDATTASNIYLNGVGADPLPSPSVNPIAVTDGASVTFSAPGVYAVAVTLTDDDHDWVSDGLAKVVVGDCDCTRSQGYWKKQFKASVSGKGKQQIDDDTLDLYLDIVGFASGVFGDMTIVEANDVFNPPKSNNGGGDGSTKGQGSRSGQASGSGNSNGGSRNGSGSASGSKTGTNLGKKRENAEKQTLAAWLNFAYGAIDWDEMIDTDDDGIGDTAFGDLIAEVEGILSNPNATADDLERAKDLAEAVNQHDKDNPDCDTKSGTGSKGDTKGDTKADTKGDTKGKKGKK